ncbi:MAG: hypothetical protein K1X55_12160 [Chitinophagales bacterium]|nr:hypothetical protein [Chitinophagales bacterium]
MEDNQRNGNAKNNLLRSFLAIAFLGISICSYILGEDYVSILPLILYYVFAIVSFFIAYVCLKNSILDNQNKKDFRNYIAIGLSLYVMGSILLEFIL